jgi:2-oxoglutarate ferredoxin oxidoreductase subunit delta
MNASAPKEPASIKTSIDIRRDWCKGCGICVAFCPKQVLELDEKEKSSVVKPDECTQCGLCELHCPDLAIELVLDESIEG